MHQVQQWRLGLAGMTGAFMLLIAHVPAAAADTSYLALSGPSSYTGPCPVTLTFNGSIVGQPNSSVTYLWARFVNGQPIDSAPTTTTIPAAGTLTIAPQALQVDAGHAGFQSYSLFVSSPPGSDSTTHGKVFFTVTCFNLPPPHLRQNMVSETPADVAALNDLATCKQHAPADACGWILADAIPNKALVLGWDVAQVVDLGHLFNLSAPQGFKVYRVDGGRHDLVSTQPFEYVRVAEVPKPSDGSYSDKCYAVTSYNATAESGLTTPFCTSTHLVVGSPHAVLTPKNVATRYRWHQRGLYYPSTNCGGLCVGFQLDSSNGTDLGDQLGIAWRTYLLFAQDKIAGLNVSRATLRLRATNGDAHCIDRVSAANGDWWDSVNWLDGDFDRGVSPSAANSTGAVVDVTATVRHWASGAIPNNGLVITGRNEDIGANQTAECLVTLGSPVLDIEWF